MFSVLQSEVVSRENSSGSDPPPKESDGFIMVNIGEIVSAPLINSYSASRASWLTRHCRPGLCQTIDILIKKICDFCMHRVLYVIWREILQSIIPVTL